MCTLKIFLEGNGNAGMTELGASREEKFQPEKLKSDHYQWCRLHWCLKRQEKFCDTTESTWETASGAGSGYKQQPRNTGHQF